METDSIRACTRAAREGRPPSMYVAQESHGTGVERGRERERIDKK